MTRKDFNLIAHTIAGLELTEADRLATAVRFSAVLRRTNESFDRDRFIPACNPSYTLNRAKLIKERT